MDDSEEDSLLSGLTPKEYLDAIADYFRDDGWNVSATQVNDSVVVLACLRPDSATGERQSCLVLVETAPNGTISTEHLKYLLKAAQSKDVDDVRVASRGKLTDQAEQAAREYDVVVIDSETIASSFGKGLSFGPEDIEMPSVENESDSDGDDVDTEEESRPTDGADQSESSQLNSEDYNSPTNSTSSDVSSESKEKTDDDSRISRRTFIAVGIIGAVGLSSWYFMNQPHSPQVDDPQDTSPAPTVTPDSAGAGAATNTKTSTDKPPTDRSLTGYPMDGYNPARTAFLSSSNAPVNNATVAWKATVGGEAHSSPVVTEDTVYVATTAEKGAGLYALDSTSGEQRWTVLANRRVRTSPAIYGDSIYVLTADTKRNLFAFNTSNGEIRWASRTGGETASSSPIVTADALYVSNQTAIQKFTKKSGEKQWTFKPKRAKTHSFLAVVDGIVYVGSRDASVYAVDAESGLEQWRFRPGNPTSSMLAAPAVSNGRLYVSTAETGVFAVDAETGKQLWQFGKGKRVNISPAASSDTVYVGFEETMYAIDATSGTQQWEADVGFITGTPVVANETVYVSSDDTLVAINAKTGEKRWSFRPKNPGGEVKSFDGAAIANGTIYAENNGTVYALN